MSVPPPLSDIVSAFKTAPKPLRIELLLEYGKRVRPLPKELETEGYQMEQVTECQTPLFIATEFPNEERVILHFDAPSEAPTTRGFAGILTEGLSGLPVQTVLETPDDFYLEMGLAEVISPLRLRGMAAMLTRLKRQIRAHLEHA
jgi:cysteine desulfuration protein SufE